MGFIRVSIQYDKCGYNCKKFKVQKLIPININEFDDFLKASNHMLSYLNTMQETLKNKIHKSVPEWVRDDMLTNGHIIIKYKYRGYSIRVFLLVEEYLKHRSSKYRLDQLFRFIVAINNHDIAKTIVDNKIDKSLFDKEVAYKIMRRSPNEAIKKDFKKAYPFYFDMN